MPIIADYIAINHQLYGIAVMIIIFILSLLGCLLLAIALIKLIIWCFFGDRFLCLSFTNKTAHNRKAGATTDAIDTKSYNKLSEEGMMQTVTTLENILLQLSKTNVTIRDTQTVCTCPHCANKHRTQIVSATDSNYNNLIKSPKAAINAAIRSGNIIKLKKTSEQLDSIQSEKLSSVVSRLVLPIVSHRQSIGAFDVKNNPSDEIQRYNSYGDVLMELKQKFASNNAINSIA